MVITFYDADRQASYRPFFSGIGLLALAAGLLVSACKETEQAPALKASDGGSRRGETKRRSDSAGVDWYVGRHGECADSGPGIRLFDQATLSGGAIGTKRPIAL